MSSSSGQPLLVVAPRRVTVQPGGEAEAQLRLRSRATIVDELAIEVLGAAAAWAAVEPAKLSLFPGDEGTARVRFTPPRSPAVAAGTVPVGVRAISTVDPVRATVEECELVIGPFCGVHAELRPRSSRGRFQGRHELRLRNDGNVPIAVALSGQETDAGCQVSVRPRRIELAAGEAARARVSVRPSRVRWVGQTELQAFEVRTDPTCGDGARLEGTMRQSPVLPRMVSGMLVAALALVGLAGLSMRGIGLLANRNAQAGGAAVSVTPSLAGAGAGAGLTPSATPSASAAASGGAPGAPGGGGGGPTAAPAGNRPGTWTAAPPMAAAREQHTATVLADGRVLVTGGYGPGATVLSSTEIYDPARRTWLAGAPMAASRAGHTASLLPSGRVLVVGGRTTGLAALASAELYDPGANRWTSAGSPHVGRFGHVAVPLPNGRVLVVGGRTAAGGSLDSMATSSAEVYDPGTNGWTPVAGMSTPRSDLTATRLEDGRVLAAGGDGAPPGSFVAAPLASAEIFDPRSGAWSATGAMRVAREQHTATLLPDGRVLAVGGDGGAPSAEVYSPSTGTWAPAGGPAVGHREHTAVLLPSGQVLVIGGAAGNEVTAGCDLYTPGSGQWAAAPQMATPRWAAAAVVLGGGHVLVSGGAAASSKSAPPLDTAEELS